jgi:hypothetical protein
MDLLKGLLGKELAGVICGRNGMVVRSEYD